MSLEQGVNRAPQIADPFAVHQSELVDASCATSLDVLEHQWLHLLGGERMQVELAVDLQGRRPRLGGRTGQRAHPGRRDEPARLAQGNPGSGDQRITQHLGLHALPWPAPLGAGAARVGHPPLPDPELQLPPHHRVRDLHAAYPSPTRQRGREEIADLGHRVLVAAIEAQLEALKVDHESLLVPPQHHLELSGTGSMDEEAVRRGRIRPWRRAGSRCLRAWGERGEHVLHGEQVTASCRLIGQEPAPNRQDTALSGVRLIGHPFRWGMSSMSSTGASRSGGDAAEAETIIERPGEPQDENVPDDPESLSPGIRLGRYVVLEEIGAGGMGMVFSAYDPELNRKVALKLLRPRHRERKRSSNRLLKEAQALAKLAHPNVITVYDVGTYGDRVFVAMELVEGDTLRGWVQEKKRKWDEVLSVFIPAGRGLAAAHAANLVHRDFKPDNVLIGRDGRVRVMDFGLARPMQTRHGMSSMAESESGSLQGSDDEVEQADESEDLEQPDESDELDALDEAPSITEGDAPQLDNPMLTQTGSIMGTPAYMAPEQHMGQPTDARSDQFSFCIALYQALYGERPFQGEDRGALAKQKLEGRIEDPPSSSSVPAWVRRHVLRGLSPRPEDRFPSMDELLDELGKDPRVKRRKILGGIGFVGAMAGLVVTFQYINRRPPVCQDSPDAWAAVWNEERAGQVSAAVTAVPGEHVGKTWQSARTAIDAYGEAWVQMHQEACEATHLRGEQSTRLLELRNNCLQERLDEVDALAELLSEPTRGTVTRSAHAAHALSPLSACADSEALAAAVDPPEGEDAKAAVAQLRRELARIKVSGTLGLHDRALQLADAAYQEAQTLGYQPVVAEARFRLGQAQGLRGDAEKAEDNMQEANWLGSSVKHDAIAAAAASELVHLIGRRMRQYDEGLSWSRHAEAAIKRIGLGGFLEARLRHDIGVIRAETGDLTQAQADLQQALELYAAVPAASLAIVDATRNLGDLHLYQGRLGEAEAAYRKAREASVELLGPAHPETSLADVGLARVADARQEHEQAITLLREALDTTRVALGPDDLDLVPLSFALARSHQEHEEFEQAIEHKRAAYTLLLDRLGDHPRVASTLYDIGLTYEAAGNPDEARLSHEQALRIWTATRGDDHPDLAYALTSLGLLDVEGGQPAAAVEKLERALKLRGGRGLDPALLAATQFALARALHATGGDHPRARELATKARDTFARGKSPDPERAASIETWLTQTRDDDETG